MENHDFEYTYSPERRQEIEAIRRKYLPREENKMDQLRKLHDSTGRKARGASIATGVVGAMVLGTGMSLCMTDLGAALGLFAMVLGIAVGLLGLVMAALAYPVYNRVLNKERRRIAPEIIRLSDELLQ